MKSSNCAVVATVLRCQAHEAPAAFIIPQPASQETNSAVGSGTPSRVHQESTYRLSQVSQCRASKCWSTHSVMDQKSAGPTQEFLDNNQYSRQQILRYERIFGYTWVSTGGESTTKVRESTTKDFLMKLGLRPGQRVLDVGCGSGGSAFFMARHYGVRVHGVDLSSNMINLAQERWAREDAKMREMVKFEVADITKVQFDNASYDVIYSRDTILHIPDKERLFKTLHAWLKPGGTLFITDYCRGDRQHSQEFLDYVKQRGYDLRTVREYGQVLREAGFIHVQAEDLTQTFISILTTELKYFEPTREAFIQDFNEDDYNDIVGGWQRKLVRCSAGDQAWGMFLAKK